MSYNVNGILADFNKPIVKTWESETPQIRYSSVQDYALDSINLRIKSIIDSRELGRGYSSVEKAYYAPIPVNAEWLQSASILGSFNFTRLCQTDVLSLIYSQSTSVNYVGSTSLAGTISPLLSKMGTMKDHLTGQELGTCTLIAYNLVLVARHAIEGRSILHLSAMFGYVQLNGPSFNNGCASFDRIVEENAQLDYAIIQLKEPLGNRLGVVSFKMEENFPMEPALLHYPLGQPLKVSVHALVQTNFQANCLVSYHDSDFLSSGGAYFDVTGRMVAMHLGSQLIGDGMNWQRYSLPIATIVRTNPHSLLAKFARGELSPYSPYFFSDGLTYLAPTLHDFLIDEEGRESKKILKELLNGVNDKNIKLNKDNSITFSENNLNYIESNYKKEFDKLNMRCLGITGLHGLTHLYSIKGRIESDHLLPQNVWKTTKNYTMKNIAIGSKGINIPALTIPCVIHRKIRTTGGVKGQKEFHAELVKLCNDNEIGKAIIMCLKEYEDKGLKMDSYKNEIKLSLDEYIKLGLIIKKEKEAIMRKIF